METHGNPPFSTVTAYVVVPHSPPFETEPDLGSGRQAHVTETARSGRISGSLTNRKGIIMGLPLRYYGIMMCLSWD